MNGGNVSQENLNLQLTWMTDVMKQKCQSSAEKTKLIAGSVHGA